MEAWLIWVITGFVFMVLEFIVPGGIIVFLGIASAIVGSLVYFGIITSVIHAFIAWFMISLFLMLVLRSVFIKYFEGDSSIQNVDQDEDSKGKIVEVVEDITPYKEGRVKYLESTWSARSDEELDKGMKAVILSREGSTWIVKSI